MRLHRPRIPLAIRLAVARRQLAEGGAAIPPQAEGETLTSALARALAALSGLAGEPMELHHRPALVNRQWNPRRRDYIPPANDPNFLIWLPASAHDIETRVRGVGAQRSDLAQRRYLKNVAKNRRPSKRRHRWPKRPLRNGRRWPSPPPP